MSSQNNPNDNNSTSHSPGNRPPAELHFISGKGGVGKSSIAAALALKFAQANQGPVLLIDVQGSGRGLKLLGLNRLPFLNTALPRTRNTWGARIMPRETFKQYFSLLLAMGNEKSAISQMTLGLRDRLVDLVFENKIVTAFVDVCPGLEPAVLLGKIHWECTQGGTPEENIPWKHVIVDAPATGHGLMLFRSAFALSDVFGTGTIFKQAMRIRSYVSDQKLCKIYLVTTPEELPIQEGLEMKTGLQKMGLTPYGFVINRCPPTGYSSAPARSEGIDAVWQNEIALQDEIWNEQSELAKNLKANAGSAQIFEVPELPQGLNAETLPVATAALAAAKEKAL